MEEEKENNGLHSIERSNLRGVRTKGATAKKKNSPRRASRPASPVRSSSMRSGRRRNSMMHKVLILVVVVIVIAVALVSTVFAKATLDLTLASADIAVDDQFSAVREPAQTADISYSKRGPYSEVQEDTITNITREKQNTRASGTVTVYNMNKSGERLELINRTRFQTDDGRIYRLIGKQAIPGGKTTEGEFVPGKKEVKVESDSVGNQFNLETKGVRFSIPGLAKYKEFAETYAVSETKIVGGFSGERFIPDEEEEEKKREDIRREIEKKLRENLAQVLETNTFADQVVFDNTIFIEYESLENRQVDSGVVIREKGTLNAISFREADLAHLLGTLASETAPRGVSPVKVNGVNQSLALEMETADNFDIESSIEFNFRLTGTATLLWGLDESLFISDIAGNKRDEVEKILLNRYPQVVRTNTFSIFPFWRTGVPSNRGKIEILTEYKEFFGSQ